MRDEVEFVKNRKKGIGGSDVADIVGVGFNTPLKVYLDKIDTEIKVIKLDPVDPKTRRLWIGQKMEPIILDWYESIVGVQLQRNLGQMHHPEKNWLIANYDGIAEIDGEKIVVDAKYVSDDKRYKWGEPGTDQVPPAYICQMLHYLTVSGFKKAQIAAWIRNEVFIYTILRNEKVMQKLESAATRFWFENVQKKIPPKPITMADNKILYPVHKESSVKAEKEHLLIAAQLKQLNLEIAEKEKEVEKKKVVLASYMASNDVLQAEDGTKVATYRTSKDGKRSLRIA